MIEQLKDFPEHILAFACHGEVTKKDYSAVLVPVVLAALKKRDKLRLFYETAPDFEGFEAGAMWEDFKLGMEHLTSWERVAIVTDVKWMEHTTRLFSFLIPAEIKVFPLSAIAEARAYISA